MSDKPQADDGAFFALAGHQVLAIDGPDALAFAQAQVMSDASALQDGQWQWSGWLTPKGRVIALFALLRLDARTLWLLLPDADAGALAERLQRYVFRSKVALAPRADLRVSGRFGAPRVARGAKFAGDAEHGVELDLSAQGGPRTLRITAGTQADSDDDSAERWSIDDLRHGLPRLPPAQGEQWTPQQLSLERLAAFSVRKGCYPGQEIVARTHFLGHAKRGLRLFRSEGDRDRVLAGVEVHDAQGTAGTVVSASGAWSLAVLPNEVEGAVQAGAATLVPSPLLDGLARTP